VSSLALALALPAQKRNTLSRCWLAACARQVNVKFNIMITASYTTTGRLVRLMNADLVQTRDEFQRILPEISPALAPIT
jgi:hypothetical protein